MGTIAEAIYRDASIGTTVMLPKAGTALENRFVYDATASDLMDMASRGLVQIVSERKSGAGDAALFTELAFMKLR